MPFNKQTNLLIFVMAVIVLVIESLTLIALYNTSFEEQAEYLEINARNQATFIAALANFDTHFREHEGADSDAILHQINDTYQHHPGFGETGEFTIGELKDNKIEFLLRSRQLKSSSKIEKPITINDANAIPMQRALSGESGHIVALDYKNKLVLAAYEPVANLNYGVVVKIDLSEVRAPFIKIATLTLFITLALIIGGAIVFQKITYPMIKKIQESDAYNRMLFGSSPIGLALCSSDGRLMDINQAYADIIGRSIEEIKNLSYWDITPKDYADDEKRLLKTLDTTGKYGPYEKEYIHKDGHRVPVSLLGQFIELNGEKYIWSSVEDISNRLETEKNILLNEKRLNEAQHLAKVGSWELDLLNNKLIWSNEIFRMFEIDQSAFEASYEAFLDVIHPDDRDKVNEAYTNSLTTQKPYEIVHRLKMNDGNIKYVRENCESFFDDEGRPIRSVGTVQDVTEIIIAEMELAKYREQLEFLVEDRTQQLRNAQDELIRKERLATLGQLTATVSHELRNPLGAMRPSLYVIEKTSDKTDTRIQSAIERVDRNISRCDRIIDELLDFTRITELNTQTTNIDRWLDSLIDDQVIAEGIQLTKTLGLDELELDIDSNRLQRAVINVIENACHSMMDNNQASVTDDNAHLDITTARNGQRVEIIISDTGAGISEDMLDKVFEPLFSTKGFGVGLGMPTVKQIIEQHSGGINIESKPGKGTKVTLWLPFHINNRRLRLV